LLIKSQFLLRGTVPVFSSFSLFLYQPERKTVKNMLMVQA